MEKTTIIEAEESRALVTADPVDNMLSQARVLLRSGMLPSHIRSPEQAVVVMVRGRELGIGPMEALTSINFIKGKVSSSTQLMLALIYRSGQLEDIEMVRGDPSTCTMKRKNMTPHTASFGSENAKRAGLAFKDNYRKYPETMYLWRAIAICARVVFPDIVGAVYTPDELGVSIRSDAELVETDWEVVDVKLNGPQVEPELLERIKQLKASGLSLPAIARDEKVAEAGLKVADVARLLK
jgi:hypothetical protein